MVAHIRQIHRGEQHPMATDVELGAIVTAMTVLGGIVSAHAPQRAWQKWSYAAAFVILGVLSAILIVKQSNETAETLKEQTAKITGGDSYPEVMAVGQPDGWVLSVLVRGDHNIPQVYFDVVSHSQRVTADNIGQYLYKNTMATQLPMAFVGHAMQTSLRVVPEDDVDLFVIHLTAPNGNWTERLTMRKSPKGWTQDVQVVDSLGRALPKITK
jgi:hypothetical protein